MDCKQNAQIVVRIGMGRRQREQLAVTLFSLNKLPSPVVRNGTVQDFTKR